MRLQLFLVLSLYGIGSIAMAAKTMTDCGSTATITKIEFAQCNLEGNGDCVLSLTAGNRLKVTFKTKRNYEDVVQLGVWLKMSFFDIKLPISCSDNICGHYDVVCPIKKDEPQTFNMKVKLPSYFPTMTSRVTVRVTTTKPRDTLVCKEINFKTV